MPQININENSSNIVTTIAGQASTHLAAFLCGTSLFNHIIFGDTPTPTYKIYTNSQDLLGEFSNSQLLGTVGLQFGDTLSNGTTSDRELHSALNYLEYGGQIVFATGVTQLNVNELELDSAFCVSRNKFSDITNLLSLRQDLIGIVGSSFEYNNGSTGTYPTTLTPSVFGISQIAGVSGITLYDDLIFSVIGRKDRTRIYGGSTSNISILMTSDVAGCMARTDASFFPWFAPAGVVRGEVNSFISVTPNFTDTDVTNFLTNEKINSFNNLIGNDGLYLLGDRTYEATDDNKKQVGISRLLLYIKRSFRPILDSILFELNDAETRAKFVTDSTAVMEFVKSGRGISSYSIVCDGSNNTTSTIQARQFVVDLTFKPNFSVNEITFRFTINQA